MWAEDCSIDEYVKKLFAMAVKWKLNKIYVEGVGAQKYLIYHLNYYIDQNKRAQPEIAHIQIEMLKTEQNQNAKQNRIDSLIPLVERHEIWINATASDKFREEAEAWGQKKGLMDLLDVAGYGLQVWNFDTVNEDELSDFLKVRMNKFQRGMRAIA